jgi:hypothetical protein
MIIFFFFFLQGCPVAGLWMGHMGQGACRLWKCSLMMNVTDIMNSKRSALLVVATANPIDDSKFLCCSLFLRVLQYSSCVHFFSGHQCERYPSRRGLTFTAMYPQRCYRSMLSCDMTLDYRMRSRLSRRDTAIRSTLRPVLNNHVSQQPHRTCCKSLSTHSGTD